MKNDDLFSEFPPVSKADWLRQITKDLKDKSLADLDWQAPNGLRVSPLVHADDFETPPTPFSEQPNDWEICENIFVTDLQAANRQALDALEGGTESLQLDFATPPDFATLAQVLEGVYLDFVGLHFAGPGTAANPGAVLGALEALARQRGIECQTLRGSLAYDPVATSSIVDWRYLAELLAFAREKFPGFRVITINPTPGPSPEGRGAAALHAPPRRETPLPSGEGPGVGSLRHANTYLSKLSERGIAPSEVAAALQFSDSVGKSYFYEIARLRAFKLLWFNVLNAWGIPLQSPCVAVQFQPEAYTDELYTNMVRGTTMAMSAVMGGAARLSVLPYDAGRETQSERSAAFSRRIARNVQHLLKMESSLHEIADPAAGSYYIERLTHQLAEQAWAAFSAEN
jgi:methylmalonyl-CoA mutase